MPTLPELYSNRFKQALPMPASIRPEKRAGRRRARIEMKSASAKLHPSLPATNLWTYEGSYPGPAIEVRSGESVEIEWANSITTPMPVTAAHVPKNGDHPPQNAAGLEAGAVIDTQYQTLAAWTTVHLHGGRTDADADGWPENLTQAGRSVFSNYQIDANDRAKMLWYHDHAMAVTRLNVYAGLAGLFLIRDAEDDAVVKAIRRTRPGLLEAVLHPSMAVEIPIVIQDRNLETDASGNLTGKLLHKVEDLPVGDEGPMEFFGPLTVVNGAIWPYTSLRRLPYRLRVLNGSNARVYRLTLRDEAGADRDASGRPYNDYVRQIGSDGGLLGAPVALPASGLTLAPAERADLILDLSTLPVAVKKLRWVNTAPVPFGNDAAPADAAAAEQGRLAYPEVMEFRVGAKVAGATPLALPVPLSSFTRLRHDAMPANHEHRIVALVERDGMLQLHELVETTEPVATLDPLRHIVIRRDAADPNPQAYELSPSGFNDPIQFVVEHGATEAWKFINLTGDTHPMHVHLTQFQISDVKGRVTHTAEDLGKGLMQYTLGAEALVDANETGWKDTIRVNPNEMVTILAPFDTRVGRYVYHCHILEHEDHMMMRPFLVLPATIAAESGNRGSGHDHHAAAAHA